MTQKISVGYIFIQLWKNKCHSATAGEVKGEKEDKNNSYSKGVWKCDHTEQLWKWIRPNLRHMTGCKKTGLIHKAKLKKQTKNPPI